MTNPTGDAKASTEQDAPVGYISQLAANMLKRGASGALMVAAKRNGAFFIPIAFYRPADPSPVEQAPQPVESLSVLIEKSKEHLAAMSEDERAAMWQAQRESFARAMSTPCEHGELDFEQCRECRAPTEAPPVESQAARPPSPQTLARVTDAMVEAGVTEIRKAKHTCFDRWTDHQAIRAVLEAALAINTEDQP